MKYPRNVVEEASINNVKQEQPHDIYTEMREYFTSVWRRFLIVSEKTIKNWKTVREYMFIGVSAILIAIFCVFNLMYK